MKTRQYLVVVFCVLSFGIYSQQISNYGYLEMSELIRIDAETHAGRTLLRRWDRKLNIDRISPKYKADFLEYNTYNMPADVLINRVKALALSDGCTPNPQRSTFRRIQYLDSIHKTSHLRQIDSLAQVWHNQLHPEKQAINARIRALFIDEYVNTQLFFDRYVRPQFNRNRNMRIVNNLRDEFNAITRKQGYIPNSFDNNCLDQIHSLPFFLNVASFYSGAERMDFWNENLNYFIATYKAGKSTNEFCFFYDLHLKNSLGIQYFGTQKDTPIKNPETFEQRKKEFEIEELIKKLKKLNRY